MDGGGRFLRPVMVGEKPASASLPAVIKHHLPVPVRSARRQRGLRIPKFLGTGSLAALFAAVGLSGAIYGGGVAQLRDAYGEFHHLAARALGFGVARVTITGHVELSEAEILAATGVTARHSVPFLDIADVRQRIMNLPLVETASVRKLYPNDIAIDITEREAFAIWQKDGELRVVASDGTPTEKFNDPRFLNLPLVVGPGANKRAKEFAALIEKTPDLRARIRAGVLIGERRWNLKMTNGIDIKLPEDKPELALQKLSSLQREQRILERDVLAIDLRIPGRMTVRLAAEPAEQRLDAAKKKMGKWQGNDA
ncbi:MAG: cell division protein FtsQ/DivIB [Beijerinckiaceae bacterium]